MSSDRDRDEKPPEPPPAGSGAGDVASSSAGPPLAGSSEASERAASAGSSGSIDVVLSGEHPAAPGAVPASAAGVSSPSAGAPSAGSSGSIDVVLSGEHPAAPSGEHPAAPSGKPGRAGASAVPAAVSDAGSAPVASGRVAAPVAITAGNETPRPHRLSAAREVAKEVIGEGVSKLGTGIETLGTGIARLGSKSHKVPIVGASVSAIGESLATVGESIHELPRVARTRRGGLLVRSAIVGFLLVFAWIVVIIALQVRGIDAPDFRPTAEHILAELSKGPAAIEQVYEDASPRFHEVARKDRFVDTMTDMHATIGRFLEIAAINESLVTTGPSGRIGRVSLTVAYEKGKARASVSLHWDQGRWKLLGLGVDVPPELKITKAQREQRVQACKDPMDPKKCDLFVAANKILEQLRDSHADRVWDEATKIFQKQEEKGRFVMLQAEHVAALGDYRRIIDVTEAKLYAGGSTATFDALTEYTKAQGVRATFGFYRSTRQDPWKLTSLKVVLPMPRADEPLGTAPETKPTDLPPPPPGGSNAPRPADDAPPPPSKPAGALSPKPGAGSAPKPAAGSTPKPAAGSAPKPAAGSAKPSAAPAPTAGSAR
ncbi:MAG TPA: hypothetical protein VNO30_48745 [Kofleriaceae bacterium]|nr:hypothetical protein [Kofleriaceae bacterium]